MNRAANIENLKAEATSLHRQGLFTKATLIYETILHAEPANADVLGLLAMALFQRSQVVEALALWQRALFLPALPRVQWRNLNNALAALAQAPSHVLAGEVRRVDLPLWPGSQQPTQEDISLAGSLARQLVTWRTREDVQHLLSAFVAAMDVSTPLAIDLLRWALAEDLADLVPACGLSRLEQLAEGNGDVQLLLSTYALVRGDMPGAMSRAHAAAALVPVYATPVRPSQRVTIGVVNRPLPYARPGVSLADFHFSENTPTGLVNYFSDDFRFVSLFPGHCSFKDLPEFQPELRVIVNNWVTAELLATEGTLETLQAFLSETRLPVLNPPERAIQTTRQLISQRLQGIEGLVAPHVVRFMNDHSNLIGIALHLAATCGFPLIIRDPFHQMGRTAFRVADADELILCLRSLEQTQFYAISYVDNPVVDGIYRKIRAAVVGDEIFITHVLYREHWNVHRERDEATKQRIESHPAIRGFADAVTRNPEAVLGAGALKSLEAIHQRVGLDIYGIDFDQIPDGRLLLFEANAAMHISFGDKFGFSEVRQRMKAALHRLLDRVTSEK